MAGLTPPARQQPAGRRPRSRGRPGVGGLVPQPRGGTEHTLNPALSGATDRRWSVIPSVTDTVTVEETAACLNTNSKTASHVFCIGEEDGLMTTFTLTMGANVREKTARTLRSVISRTLAGYCHQLKSPFVKCTVKCYSNVLVSVLNHSDLRFAECCMIWYVQNVIRVSLFNSSLVHQQGSKLERGDSECYRNLTESVFGFILCSAVKLCLALELLIKCKLLSGVSSPSHQYMAVQQLAFFKSKYFEIQGKLIE
ncbi:uncharacterized protein LOC115344170 isoform X2 [Aquila chrysaetos chrysaetos]|uniref:uncharacterized protein LOC115344170 isoform X2 n=1 Tax=Aquila chrysaetos chrysaetos TaxID=223781 RepID=UPI00117724B0|nr:uncharacterized protein LOC115344170 isoform X2 [Aquila chrysaetos chrysaetos]